MRTKVLAAIGSINLLTVAGMHMTGLGDVKSSVVTIESEFMQQALPAMWIMPSLHMIFMACLAVGLSFYKSRIVAAMLMAFGVWLWVDAALVYMHVGVFIGNIMLVISGLLYFVAGYLLRRERS